MKKNTGSGRFGKRMAVAVTAVFAAVLIGGQAVMAAGLLKPVSGGDAAGIRIKSHKVSVTINNGFSRTEVDQVFTNDSDSDMEALYTFPLPKQASLSELSLWIDGKEVLGEVLEKKRAREIYEQQKAQGNETALAEKDDFKTFDVSVGNIRAHSDTRVRLVYYQPLEIDLGVGRYVYPLAEGGVDEQRIAFWSVDNKVDGPFSFHLKLKSAFPVKDVRLPGLDQVAQVTKASPDGAQGGDVYDVAIDRPAGADLSRDIVFYYRLDDTVPARLELIPYKQAGAKEGTFMVVVTPAASLKPIAEGTDWIFVLDQSGSMSGNKIATLADGVSRVLGTMSPKDRFRIITFNQSAHDMTRGFVQASPENVQQWISRVKTIQASGSTALFAGLKKAYKSMDEDRTTGIILVTDGVCNVGPTQHADFLNLMKQYDVRLFTFVIGNSANQPLMDRLAKDSGGFAMNISDSDDIAGRLLQAKAKISHECMHDVRLKFHGEKVHDLTPTSLGNLYMGQQLVMFGHYTGSGKVKVELDAKISGLGESWQCTADLPEADTDNPELERLWALSSIHDAMQAIREKGESESLRKKVVDLGLNYSLVTDYTSMVVVRNDVMENLGIQRRNAQRVARERQAQQARAAAPVRNHTADNGKMFHGAHSPGIGSGPVGPGLLGLIFWFSRRKRKAQ